MYSNGKIILGHNTNDFGYKNIVKRLNISVKFHDFGSHFENMQIRSLRRHFSACQHWFSDSAYQIPLIKVSNPFIHKMPVLVNFSDIFPDYIHDFGHGRSTTHPDLSSRDASA